MRFLRLLPLAWLLGAALASPAPSAPDFVPVPNAASAQIAPARTSIYLGNVLLTVLPLQRQGAEYVSTYTAKVFPFFFCNEEGKFRLQVSDAEVGRLATGQPIDFEGTAVRQDGVARRVQGHAVPHGLVDGDVKIRVYLSRRLVLIFNTTYRLMGPIK